MIGMISERHDGQSIAELSGIYLGNGVKWGMRLFSVLLLLLTGTVFVNSPAALIADLTPEALSIRFWIVVILIYYVLATLLPIDKIIGKLYPVFGVTLIIMAASIFFGIIAGIFLGVFLHAHPYQSVLNLLTFIGQVFFKVIFYIFS